MVQLLVFILIFFPLLISRKERDTTDPRGHAGGRVGAGGCGEKAQVGDRLGHISPFDDVTIF